MFVIEYDSVTGEFIEDHPNFGGDALPRNFTDIRPPQGFRLNRFNGTEWEEGNPFTQEELDQRVVDLILSNRKTAIKEVWSADDQLEALTEDAMGRPIKLIALKAHISQVKLDFPK